MRAARRVGSGRARTATSGSPTRAPSRQSVGSASAPPPRRSPLRRRVGPAAGVAGGGGRGGGGGDGRETGGGALWSTWAGQQPSHTAYAFDGSQWLLDGSAITGATGQSSPPTAADAGHQLSCKATVTYPL